MSELYANDGHYETYVAAQRTDTLQERYSRILGRLTQMLAPNNHPHALFDVGAGAGAFLDAARSAGFDVLGNEISEPAIRMCYERYGIKLSNRELTDEPGVSRFDAITMWCVVAHVATPRDLLSDALRLLRPLGILYFQTPRWCLIDTLGLSLTRATRGRMSHITERRINAAHLRLYNQANLRSLLHSVGFEVLDLRSRCAYSLRTEAYLGSLRVPPKLHQPVACGCDRLIRSGAFFRNIFDVYARKPAG
ncbi:MAG: class I SAM-dependent methyltransferase [Actinobacteria bacterium]|nr:class I SAM-dependent methyltransferase [Actinomycetota bacterium]